MGRRRKERGWGQKKVPDNPGEQRQRHHHRHENGGDVVRKRLDGCLRHLGILDQAHYLGQGGIRPHPGGLYLHKRTSAS